jgi:hypothetical protein
MSAPSRAAEMESEANRPVRRPAPDSGDFTSLPPRRFCRHHFIGVGAAFRRRPVFRTSTSRAFPRRLLARSAPAGSAASPVTLAAHLWAIGRSPCIPERASSEVPGAVTPRAVRFAARSSLGRSPPSRRIHANTELASDASVRGPVGGPPSSRSRRRGPGGSPSTDYKGKEGALTVARWSGEKPGSRRSRRSRTSAPGLLLEDFCSRTSARGRLIEDVCSRTSARGLHLGDFTLGDFSRAVTSWTVHQGEAGHHRASHAGPRRPLPPSVAATGPAPGCTSRSRRQR